jgi:hypothetical protein
MPENTWNVITGSLDLLRNAAALLNDANREAPTPCSKWTVTQVLQHATGDQLAWAAAIGVGTGPSENPFTPSGHLEGSIDDLTKPALDAARTAWTRVVATTTRYRPRSRKAPSRHRRRPRPAPWTPPCTPGTSPWHSASPRRCPTISPRSSFPRPAPSWNPCASSAPTHQLSRHSQQTTTRPNFCVTSAGTPTGPLASELRSRLPATSRDGNNTTERVVLSDLCR